MNEIFSPTLVMSVGPSANKALGHLKEMLISIPDYLNDVIELYEMSDLIEVEAHIQKIIDDKLLNAKKINRLVDLGYKIRTESTANIQINIFLYWDLYETDFPMKDLTEILLKVNYCMVDKTKHSGMSLFILPVLDKEWAYAPKESNEKLNELKAVVDILKKDENIININSKVYLTHTVARDGLRIPKKELEYLIALMTYLTILPSENPLLNTYNKRLMMHEKDFKIGTIGISTLTVFKDKLKGEFSQYLSKDLKEYGSNHLEEVDYNVYTSNTLIKGKNISNLLSAGIPLFINNEDVLAVPEKYEIEVGKERIWNRQPHIYKELLDNKESKLNKEFLGEVKEEVVSKKEKLLLETKGKIYNDLNSIILNYSLLQGKSYLEDLLGKVRKESVKFRAEKVEKDSNLKEKLISKIESYPNFKGYWLKFTSIFIFMIYALLLASSKVTLVSRETKAGFIVLLLTFIVSITVVEYVFMDKQFIKFIKKYIENIYIYGAASLKKTIAEEVRKYYEEVIMYIEAEIKAVEESIIGFNNLEVYSFENRDKEEEHSEVLITDLLNSEDRKRFYDNRKKHLRGIYSRFMGEISGFESLKEPSCNKTLKEFCFNIAEENINIDFYDFLRFKWENNLGKEVGKWMEKAVVKSKELLQYNQDYDLENQRIFVGSKVFNHECKDTIINSLNNYKLSNLEGKGIYTNSISLINLTLGIKLEKIIPFQYIEGRDKDD